MNIVLNFIRAAAPWLIIGLAIIIFAVRSIKRNCKSKDGDRCAEGMSLGMCFGLLIGTALKNTALGISLGMLLGLAAGMCIPKKPKDSK